MRTTTEKSKSDGRIKKFFGKDPELVITGADMYIGRYHYQIRHVPKKLNGHLREFPYQLSKHQFKTVRGKRKDTGWYFRYGFRTFEDAVKYTHKDLEKRIKELS